MAVRAEYLYVGVAEGGSDHERCVVDSLFELLESFFDFVDFVFSGYAFEDLGDVPDGDSELLCDFTVGVSLLIQLFDELFFLFSCQSRHLSCFRGAFSLVFRPFSLSALAV